MKPKLFILTVLWGFGIINAFPQSPYYYHRGQKVFIQEDTSKCCVVNLKSSTSSLLRQVDADRIKVITDSNFDIAIYSSQSIAATRSSGWSYLTDSTSFMLPCYKNANGKDLNMTPYLYVKLKRKEDLPVLESRAAQHHLTIVSQSKSMPLWYTLSITARTGKHTLDMANELFETGLSACVNPDFSYAELDCSYDPDFLNQWPLYNLFYADVDLSICSAWNYATGSGIKIAIVDEGVELSHQDLQPNIYSSIDLETMLSPSVVYSSHGTHCAGIAAAVRNNGIGIAGVAPDAKIMSASLRISASTRVVNKFAEAVNWAWENGADIISCSWTCGQSDYLEDAIDDALRFGRNGKGCIIVKSAGNTNGGGVSYPAAYRSEILVVGSINQMGTLSSYSATGNEIDFVAPGEIILSTSPGNSYTTGSGTSMAAPHVSVIAELILERNPLLSSVDVRNIIERNTTKIDSENYSYTTTSSRTNGTWNNRYGYGLVNAFQAIIDTPRW